MDDDAVKRAKERLSEAREGRPEPADLEAALQRAREAIEGLAQSTAELETGLTAGVEEAVQQGIRAEALPVARQLAEVRGLMGQAIRRLERLEGEMLAERFARVDDLALLVDLVSSGWKGVDERLGRLEQNLSASSDAVVYRIEERRNNG